MSQDHVPQRERPITAIYPRRWPVQVSNVYLTKMERQILRLLGKQLSIIEISEVLEISRNTVDQHIHNIRSKS